MTLDSLTNEINSQLPTNASGQITAAKLRAVLIDIINDVLSQSNALTPLSLSDSTPGPGFTKLAHDLLTRTFFWDSKPSFSAAKSLVRNGIRNARIVCIGDSTTAGATATDALHSYPHMLAGDLAGFDSIRAKRNSIFGMGNQQTAATVAAFDPRVTFTGTWTPSIAYTFGGSFYSTSVSGATFNFTPADAFDTIEVYVVGSAGNPASWDISIDSGATLLNAPAGTVDLVGRVTVTVPLGTHTIHIKNHDGNLNGFFGVNAYDSTQKEVSVFSGGIGTTGTPDWSNTTFPFQPILALPVLRPDLVIVDLTINDFFLGVSIPTFELNLQTIIDQCRLAGAEVLFVTGTPVSTDFPSVGVGNESVAIQDSYQATYKAIAAVNGIRVVDIYQRWGGTWVQANADGYFGGNLIHPNDTGYADIAYLVSQAVRAL